VSTHLGPPTKRNESGSSQGGWRESEGLDRHDAIHAIGSVLSGHVDSLLRDSYSQDQPNESYQEALRKLAASEWKAG
jgi:hypothetical protein